MSPCGTTSTEQGKIGLSANGLLEGWVSNYIFVIMAAITGHICIYVPVIAFAFAFGTIATRSIRHHAEVAILENTLKPENMTYCSIGKDPRNWKYATSQYILETGNLCLIQQYGSTSYNCWLMPRERNLLDYLFFTCLGFWGLLVASNWMAAKLSTLGISGSSLPRINSLSNCYFVIFILSQQSKKFW